MTEGMRLRSPRSEPMPDGMTRFGQLYFRAAQEYGVVVDDQTGSTVASRVQLNAPRCRELFDGRPLHKQLDRIPWGRMVLLKAGSDAQPNPEQ